MDVDIDNLEIKADVEDQKQKQQELSLNEGNPFHKAAEIEMLVEKCVELVLKQLEKKC